MQSSIPVNARSLQRRYSLTLLLSAALLLMGIAAYGWVAILAEQKALFANIQSESAELQLSLSDTIDVAQSHVSTMRHSVETRLANTELADSEFFDRMHVAASGSPKDAPWDNMPPDLRSHVGSLHIDTAAKLQPKLFKRDIAAASNILALASGIHAHHNVFQWSYYYDAKEQWLLLYPAQSRKELLNATNTQDTTSTLKVVFNADGTLPVVAVGPIKNPEREMIWTRPYLDAGGKGLMVTLLAPVYLGTDYVGAVGTDVTLAILNTVLLQRPLSVGRAFVVDGSGAVLADSGSALKGLTEVVSISDIIASAPLKQMVTGSDAKFEGIDATWIQLPLRGTSWKLLVEVPHLARKTHLVNALKPYIAMAVLLLVSILTLAWIQNRRYARPALKLAEYVDLVESEPEKAAPKVPGVWQHRFEHVAQTARERRELLLKTMEHAEQLEAKVKERTAALSDANAQLLTTIDTLKSTQSQLVRSEKLAGLGSMVAGVAHELNTPLGNALLMITTLNESSKAMQNRLQQGLRKSDLSQFIAEVDEATHIVERNVDIASKLVQRFKEVAVNQTSEQHCTFNLCDTAQGVLIVMGPTISKLPFNVVNQIPTDIAMDSYPGAIAQVLTNLISNACSHAFEGRSAGKIVISAHPKSGERITLTVADDGGGIEAKNLPRIFDPFFTTKMGRGGTGLGLHIVLNVVEEILGGTVQVASTPEGTIFSLLLPLNAPIRHSTTVADV